MATTGQSYKFNFWGMLLLIIITMALSNSPKIAPYIVGILILIIVSMILLNYKNFVGTFFTKG